MNFSLWTVEEALILMYKELIHMQIVLQSQKSHSAGALLIKHKKNPNERPEIYYRYSKDGVRHLKKVPFEEREVYEKQILAIKEQDKEARAIKEKINRLQICFRALHCKPEQYISKNGDLYPPAPTSTFYTKGLRHLTLHGEYVRSKSEALLANLLFYHGIPYEYEKAVDLKGYTIHPDFTITLPDGAKLFWEHLGMLDDPVYAKKWAIKNQTYLQSGIAEGNGLIITRDKDGIFDPIDASIKLKTYCRALIKKEETTSDSL